VFVHTEAACGLAFCQWINCWCFRELRIRFFEAFVVLP